MGKVGVCQNQERVGNCEHSQARKSLADLRFDDELRGAPASFLPVWFVNLRAVLRVLHERPSVRAWLLKLSSSVLLVWILQAVLILLVVGADISEGAVCLEPRKDTSWVRLGISWSGFSVALAPATTGSKLGGRRP